MAACLTALSAGTAIAGPTVVPTAEGQVGTVPGGSDQLQGTRFESVRGQAGDILLGGLTVFGGGTPPPPEFSFVLDRIHSTPNPVGFDQTPVSFDDTFPVLPASARQRNAAGDDDFVAFSFASDGTTAGTMTVRVRTFDSSGSALADVPLADVTTFPDPSVNSTGVAVDNQGRVTVVYTDLPVGLPARVHAQRLDAVTGGLIGGPIPISDDGHAFPSVALLDPAGNRLVVPTSDFGAIRGNILDVSGATPVVLPEFEISTTPGFANFLPTVAADPATGNFIVAWENITGDAGDPVNIRGRRFDADGNPIGGEFLVNTTTADAQGQPAAAAGPNGLSAVVWAGDAAPGDELDVFLQVFDADGNPIGGEVNVNTSTAEVQDRPAVRFLPELDGQGRPQVVVTWRDVGVADGTMANGTGTSYRCFAINGIVDPMPIFADGFESGDTTSW